MNKMDTLTTLFSHNLWANLMLLEKCKALSSDQLDTSLEGTFGSIRDTFQHIALAERAYLSRISTGKRYYHPKDADPMTLFEIRESLQVTGKGLLVWSAKVQVDDVVEIDWDGVLRDVPKTTILTQVINHATEHRAQIMVILTQLGIEPPDLDSWTYFLEMKK
jgi:uncharacterized damage-inducible protein DinB